jgi:flavin reductase (DIM6/NTAB) family NADH-FMN oxidoreductase RutF
MLLDFTTLLSRDAYAWMVSTITPRPIAWVATMAANGKTNLAPFSFFNGVCASPPTLMFSVANRPDGSRKDTVRNLETVPEFTVSLVSFALAEPMNACAAELPHGESEFERFGIAAAPSTRVRPPRVAAAPVAFECTLDRIVNIGEGPLAANVIFGRILFAHVSDAALDSDGRADPAKLDVIGRLGGESYTRTRETFALKRPDRRA